MKNDVYEYFATQGNTIYKPVTGETGILYAQYPVGDVRRYGIFPDGVTNWETDYSSRMLAVYANACLDGVVCTFPPGFYATGMNLGNTYSGLKFHMMPGAEFGSIIHLIATGNSNARVISSISRASNVVTITTSTSHGFTTGELKRITGVLGGTTDFNIDGVSITVTGATTFTYSQTGADESGTVSGTEAYVVEKALSNVRITGTLTSYDRVGTINCIDSYIQRIHIKNDPTKHTIYPGTKARGVHIYGATERLSIDEIIVDDCGNANNTDAAVAIDSNPLPPRDIRVNKILVKKSDVHGVYIMGSGHWIGDITVLEYSALQNQNGLQGSNSLAQSQEGKGVWINRAWNVSIDRLRVTQSLIGTRTYAKYHVMVDETGNTSISASRIRGIRIGRLIAHNLTSRGVSFGDRNYNTTGAMRVHVDSAEIQLALSATIDSGYQALQIEKNPDDSTVYLGHVDFINMASQPCSFTASGTVLGFGRIESRSYSGQVLNGILIEAQGRLVGTSLRLEYVGGSATGPFVYLNGSGANDSSIDNIYVNASALVSGQAFKASTVTRARIGKIRTMNFRNATGTVELSSLTACIIEDISAEATTSAGTVGLLVNGVTDCQLGRVTVSGFATGVKKGAGSITRSTVLTAYVTGNTTNTDIPNGSFTALLQSGFQL